MAPPKQPDPIQGRRVYDTYCATCHGQWGDGNGPTARHTDTPPTNFTYGIYKFRSTPTGILPTDDDLVRVIGRGVLGTRMPAWDGVLGEKGQRDVAAYLKTFNPRFVEEADEIEPIHIPEPLEATPESVARGRNIFLLAKCYDCHGVEGEGDGPSAPSLVDQMRRPTSPRDLTTGVFKGGDHPEDIYRLLATGMDGTPMPSYAQTLLMVREYEQQLEPIRPFVTPEEFGVLMEYVQAQMPMAEFYELDEEAQAKLVEGWRWDLAHYILSLSEDSWGDFWGTTPSAPLFGD